MRPALSNIAELKQGTANLEVLAHQKAGVFNPLDYPIMFKEQLEQAIEAKLKTGALTITEKAKEKIMVANPFVR